MPASPRRLFVPLLVCLALVVTALLSGPATAATPDPAAVVINEVRSNPGVDFVELYNTGTEPIDITGWKAVDSGATQTPVVIAPTATTIAPGDYFAFEPDTITGGFGLGAADSITILLSDGTTKVASYAWTTHRTPSFGRCPGGADLVVNATATKGAANDCPAPDPKKVRINEVRSNPGIDFVELYNSGAQPIDITGWKAVDSGATQTPIVIAPTATTIAPGGYFAFEPDTITGGFGLGGADSITVYAKDGTTVIDTYAWSTHRTPSFGRCPAGTGDLVVNTAATKGAKNACPVPAGGENVKINEVESDPTDRIELVNSGSSSVDLTGYVLRDESDTSLFTIPSGTTIGAGAVRVFDVSASFGLGKGDSARLYAPGGETLLDTTTWPAGTHATTWGRCPDGTGSFAATQSTMGLPNQCGAAVDPATVVKINEVESNGDKVADWVELTNTGSSTVDVSGWKILDNDPAHTSTPVVVPDKTTIAPGAFYAIYTEVNQSPGFGLGGADSVTLLLPDGTAVVDTYAWTVHAATTYGRCPDGTGAFRTTTTSTRGASNACSPVRLNEIESDAGSKGGDWVELANIGDTAVDVSGWSLKDSGDAGAYTFPAGSTVPAKGYRVVDAGEGGFGFSLDAGDTVRLLGPDDTTVVESYTWTNPATVTYGRCKDGVGDFVDTRTASKGAANICPGLDTEPWPGSQEIRTADLTDTFKQDLSGLVFDPKDPDVLWAAQNKLGTLFKLVRGSDNIWVPDAADGWGAGKTPTYLDGTGAPDTEGITVGPDGFLYAASERNNAASGISRMSVLRYAPNTSATTLTATDEWDLTSKIPAAGANLGLEGVTWVPDSFLVANGFVDQSTGAAYRPSDYPLHGTGLYVVAVEDTGALHAFALDSTGGTSHRIATIASGFAHLADVTFDPERQRLWAVTDDTHDGRTSLLKLQGGGFVVAEAYDRPVTMPNLNNEGFALAPQSRCVGGTKEVLWSDDGDTGGHSLRSGLISCTVPATQTVTFTSTAPAPAVVGQTYTVAATGGASGSPVTFAAAGACTVAGSTVRFTAPGTCTVTGTQAAAQGYASGTATQSVTVAKASTTTTASVVGGRIVATVSVTTPGAGDPRGTVEFSVDGTVVGTADVQDGSAALTAEVPTGAERTVTAVYSGDPSFAGSASSTVRRDPTITASVSPRRPVSGWYSAPVTVTFTCSAQGSPLAGECPGPVVLRADGAGQKVSGTVTAVDGGAATATVTGIGIDRTAPVVRIRGAKQGRLYVGSKPSARCVATDATSGIASCRISRTVTPTRTTLVATATDRAGLSSRTSVSYRTLAYEIRGARYRDGAFELRRGRTYTLVGTVRTGGRVLGPVRRGVRAEPTGRLRDGRARVTIPRSAKAGSRWKIEVDEGRPRYVLKVTARR